MPGKKTIVMLFVILLAASFCLCIEDEGDEEDEGSEDDLVDDEDKDDDEETSGYIGNYEVTRVIDGDTLEIEGGKKVRLIGINTPEKGQPYYKEATDKLEDLVLDKEVRLEMDVTDEDMYDRLLRYIYVGDAFVNLEIVKAGLATSYEYEPDTKYQEMLDEAEQEAKDTEVGMWAMSAEDFDIVTTELHFDAEGNDKDNLNDEYVVFYNNGSQAFEMTDWTIRDESNSQYTFPVFTLEPSANVTLYTGSGEDTDTDLYWGMRDPVWNNKGDTLHLRDDDGMIVLDYDY